MLCPINSVKLLIFNKLQKFFKFISFMGGFNGGQSPPMPKNGYFKAEGEYRVGGKIRNNRNFRIIGQGNYALLCPINSVKGG